MVWLLLLVFLIVIFGLGSVLKATFWVLVIIAIAVVALTVLVSRAISD